MHGRLLTAAALAVLAGACAGVGPIRSLTQADREEASRKAAGKPGAFITEAELEKMDLDRTFICEVQAPIGSRIPRYQCRSLRRVQRERDIAAAWSQAHSNAPTVVIPAELAPSADSLQDLLATQGAKIVGKDQPKPRDGQLPTADDDPRYPGL